MERTKLIRIIIKEDFGDVVGQVATSILDLGRSTLRGIILDTKLSPGLVKDSLMVLIQQNLVDCYSEERIGVTYEINVDHVLMRMRFPKFMDVAKKRFGAEGELIIEEFLEHGRLTMDHVLKQAGVALNDLMSISRHSEQTTGPERLKEVFIHLVVNHFIMRAEDVVHYVVKDDGPDFQKTKAQIIASKLAAATKSQAQADANFRLPSFLAHLQPNMPSLTNPISNTAGKSKLSNPVEEEEPPPTPTPKRSRAKKTDADEAKPKAKRSRVTKATAAADAEKAAATPTPRKRLRKTEVPEEPEPEPQQEGISGTDIFFQAETEPIDIGGPSQLPNLFGPDPTPEAESEPEPLWRVNYDQFMSHFRNEACIAYVQQKYDNNGAHFLRAMFKLVERQMRTRKDDTSVQMNKAVLDAELAANPETQHIQGRTLDQQYEWFWKDSKPVISRPTAENNFYIQMGIMIETLRLRMIESIIQEKFGAASMRIFHLLLMKRYLEANNMAEMAMVPPKEARTLLYQMVTADYIRWQDVARSADHMPSKSAFLFGVDLETVRERIASNIYKSLYNLKARLAHETEKHKGLIARFEANGESSLNIQEQELYEKVLSTQEKLHAALINLDDTLRLIVDY